MIWGIIAGRTTNGMLHAFLFEIKEYFYSARMH